MVDGKDYVCGKYLKSKGKIKRLKDDTVVTTVMSNLGLQQISGERGMK